MEYSSTPSVQIDLDIVEKNIREAVQALKAHGIAHRPHIKVHKSVALAKLQQEWGCKGITCAKLGEAEVMVDGGIQDILLAYPLIGRDKLERYRMLVQRGIRLRTIINSVEGARGLSELGKSIGMRLPVLIELDGGIGRGGLKAGDELKSFGKNVLGLHGICVEGVEYYGGDIYGCKTSDEIRARARKERDDILESSQQLSALGLSMQVLSGGSSFSLCFPEALEGLTEVRAGNYIFNDSARLSIGMVSVADCALRVRATIVARPSENTAIIDAGSKTLTTDTVAYRRGYGMVLENKDAEIVKLNEEHGFVQCAKALSWKIGKVITIIPNHACTVPNLCEEIYAMRKGNLAFPIRIDARGKNR